MAFWILLWFSGLHPKMDDSGRFRYMFKTGRLKGFGHMDGPSVLLLAFTALMKTAVTCCEHSKSTDKGQGNVMFAVRY